MIAAASAAFGRRDLIVAWSYKTPFVMTFAGTLVSLITFRFISRLVADADALRGAGDYFSFVVVGLVMTGILEAAIGAPAAQARSEQVQGTLELLATQPLPPRALAAGWASYPLVLASLTGALTLGAATALGLRLGDADWVLALAGVGLASAAFVALGVLIAAFVLVFQQGAQLTRWISAPMALLGGVFFPLELLPRWVAIIAEASPLTHALRVVRGGLLEGRAWGEMTGDLIALAATVAILVPVSVWVLGRAMDRARARGTLATY